MSIWTYFDDRAKRLGILDTKLVGGAVMCFTVVIVKLVPEILEAVIGRRLAGRGATLRGYARFLMRGETFPAIIPHAASETRGLVFDGISARELAVLDAYEGAMYARVRVRPALDSGTKTDAMTYVLLSEHCDRLTDRPWDCERFAVEELVQGPVGFEHRKTAVVRQFLKRARDAVPTLRIGLCFADQVAHHRPK